MAICDFIIKDGKLIKYTGTDSDVIIPDDVNFIGFCAFENCTNLVSVTIPKSVTFIGANAFYGCVSLTSVNLLANLSSSDVGEYAFEGCVGLADENGFIIIKNILYRYCGQESYVAIPENVIGIGSRAFSDCTNLQMLSIPDSVKKIYFTAFFGHSDLTIFAPKGSVAENFAKHKRFHYIDYLLPDEQKENLKRIYATPIDSMGLSEKTRNSLYDSGNKNIGDLMRFDDIYEVKILCNIGIRSAREIAKKLEQYGICNDPWSTFLKK